MTHTPNMDEQLISQLKQLAPTGSPGYEQELFYKLGFQAGAKTVTPVANASMKSPIYRSVALTLVASILVTVLVGWNAYHAGVKQGETVAAKSPLVEKPVTGGKEKSTVAPSELGSQAADRLEAYSTKADRLEAYSTKADRLEAYPTEADRLEAYPTFAWLIVKLSASKQDSIIDDLTSEIKDPLHPKLRVRPSVGRPVLKSTIKPSTRSAGKRSAVTNPWTGNSNDDRWLEDLL